MMDARDIIFMEQLLRPPILEGNEIELRPSGELLTRLVCDLLSTAKHLRMMDARDIFDLCGFKDSTMKTNRSVKFSNKASRELNTSELCGFRDFRAKKTRGFLGIVSSGDLRKSRSEILIHDVSQVAPHHTGSDLVTKERAVGLRKTMNFLFLLVRREQSG
ncbi:hypothetical protein DY000_02010176 [Brassica cretica]|uniref:Uncharacterized protein n=1 Tax=Brassica cretica TaxID=69181 RepID=A0ABQ7CGM6_BRACR|nr:hypothetical protein DY000_02010176 [Brassica cretica]